MSKSKRFDTDYKRPKSTFQEQLSSEEIKEMLQGYEQLEDNDISEIPIGTHIRYFVRVDGQKKPVFRTGGFLVNRGDEKYFILGNNKVNWSVQYKTLATVYRKLSFKEQLAALEEKYEKKIREKDKIINKLKEYVRDHKIKTGGSKSRSKSGRH